ncbi:hypothetical protein V9T40_010767 [Parthenolecanium corni]|uniref:Uncharacterized protein n=1 Tax=Parthenolecanium corni TaxID=536013 RepID=A0AAN9T5S5_9HEMI
MDQCLLKRGAGSPTDVALKNAQELKNLGVGLTEQVAFVINGQYKCVSNSAYYYWVQTICTMLEQNLAKSIAACKKMGW